jgi:hypothetical protein
MLHTTNAGVVIRLSGNPRGLRLPEDLGTLGRALLRLDLPNCSLKGE